MRSETELFRFSTFNPHPQIGLIEGLLNSQIGCPGNVPHLRQQRVCILAVSLQIVSDDLNIDRGRQAKVENLRDHVGGQERERDTRKLLRECQAKLVNVVVGGMMLGRQSYQDVSIRCAHRRRIAVGKIDAAVGQPYVVDDVMDFIGWNLLSNRPLDLIAEVGRLFNAHSCGSAHVKLERAAVHAGKEIAAQPG